MTSPCSRERALVLGTPDRKGRPHITPCGSAWVVYYAAPVRSAALAAGYQPQTGPRATFALKATFAAAADFAKGLACV